MKLNPSTSVRHFKWTNRHNRIITSYCLKQTGKKTQVRVDQKQTATTKKTRDSCLATKKSQYFHGWYKFKLKTLQRHCSFDVWCYQKRGPIIKYAFIVNIKQLWSLITFENTKRKKSVSIHRTGNDSMWWEKATAMFILSNGHAIKINEFSKWSLLVSRKEFQFSFNFQNKYEIQFWINGAKDMHAFHYMDVQFVVCKYMQTSSPN